jgi:hypothetical protein
MMRIECASNMVSHVRQNVCDFHYLRENIYIFSTCKKNSIITVVTYLSSELFPFYCMYIMLPFSILFYYIRPSSILNSPRFHAYCYLPSFCLSHASPGSHFFFFTPLFWFLCAMCTTFSSIFNFPHTRSVDHNCLERGCTA